MVNPLDSAQRLRTDRIETLVDRAGLMQNAPASEETTFCPESTRLMTGPFETIASLAKQLDAGRISSRELVEDTIVRIES